MLVDWFLVLVIGLFIIGFILMGIEMITPGLNAPGILGAICLVVAIFLVSETFVEGAIITIIVLAILAVMLGVILGLLSRGKLKSPIILKEQQSNQMGYISANDLTPLLGKHGVALTDLRPTGVGSFDGRNYDVISEGEYILKGSKLVIFKVQGSKLLVKELD